MRVEKREVFIVESVVVDVDCFGDEYELKKGGDV